MWSAVVTFLIFKEISNRNLYLGTAVEFVSSWPSDCRQQDAPEALQSWSPWKPDSDIVLRSLDGAPSREPFVPDEISSTTFQQHTLQLPSDSFLIEMQINLCGWLHFPYSSWQVQL